MRFVPVVSLWALLAGPAFAQERAEHDWLDVSLEPLPFETEAELLTFLETAEVVDETEIGVGINKSVRLTLEQGGVRAHAIFREADVRERLATIEGVQYRNFADSFKFECAAYVLGKMLDLDMVPPVVPRKIGRREGSVQIWLEDSIDEEDDGFRPPKALVWAKQLWDMEFFDSLIYNIDRNGGNILVDSGYRVWLIDHTRAFALKRQLMDEDLARVPRRAWERLLALDEDAFRDKMRDYLTPQEMSNVLGRRKNLIEHVEKLIAERGEGAVLY